MATYAPPPPRYGGRPRVDDRAALAGILYQLHTGIPWRLRCPPASSAAAARSSAGDGCATGNAQARTRSACAPSVGHQPVPIRRPRQAREQVPPVSPIGAASAGGLPVGCQHPRLDPVRSCDRRGPARQGAAWAAWAAAERLGVGAPCGASSRRNAWVCGQMRSWVIAIRCSAACSCRLPPRFSRCRCRLPEEAGMGTI
jgi:hypothetical protein